MSDFVYFTFPKIDTYLNAKGEAKKKPVYMPSWKAINRDNFIIIFILIIYVKQLLLVK